MIARGIEHTRQVMLPRAAFLLHAGYHVLTPDLRGHRESGASVVSPGFLAARDLLAAERFARAREPEAPVAVLGLSYSAVAALLAAGQSTGFAAVSADRAFPSGRAVYDRVLDRVAHARESSIWMPAVGAAASAPGAVRTVSLVYCPRPA